MVKRARAPNKGLWTIPGGKIKKGETLYQAAQREVLEETGLTVQVKYPIYCFNLITASSDRHYQIMDVLAEVSLISANLRCLVPWCPES